MSTPARAKQRRNGRTTAKAKTEERTEIPPTWDDTGNIVVPESMVIQSLQEQIGRMASEHATVIALKDSALAMARNEISAMRGEIEAIAKGLSENGKAKEGESKK